MGGAAGGILGGLFVRIPHCYAIWAELRKKIEFLITFFCFFNFYVYYKNVLRIYKNILNSAQTAVLSQIQVQTPPESPPKSLPKAQSPPKSCQYSLSKTAPATAGALYSPEKQPLNSKTIFPSAEGCGRMPHRFAQSVGTMPTQKSETGDTLN